MLDNTIMTIKEYTNINIKPACGGLIQRSHAESKFVLFDKNSNLARTVFNVTIPYVKTNTFGRPLPISVLQVMLIDDKFIVEYLELSE